MYILYAGRYQLQKRYRLIKSPCRRRIRPDRQQLLTRDKVRGYKFFYNLVAELSVAPSSGLHSRVRPRTRTRTAPSCARCRIELRRSYFLRMLKVARNFDHRTSAATGNRVMATGHEKNEARRRVTRRDAVCAPAATNCASSRALTSDATGNRNGEKHPLTTATILFIIQAGKPYFPYLFTSPVSLSQFYTSVSRIPSLSSRIRPASPRSRMLSRLGGRTVRVSNVTLRRVTFFNGQEKESEILISISLLFGHHRRLRKSKTKRPSGSFIHR